MVAPPVGNNLDDNIDLGEPDIDDPDIPMELRNLQQSFVDVDVSQPRTLRSGREIGTVASSTLLSDLNTFTVVHQDSIFNDFAVLSVDPMRLNPLQYRDHLEIPTIYNEAWHHPCEFQRKLWREAIMMEFNKMMNYKVWDIVKRNVVPPGRKCVKSKWVFDIKRNGVFRARLVACGYSQVPGVDFQESYSPVINDAVFRMLLVLQLALCLKGVIIDIETQWRINRRNLHDDSRRFRSKRR
jgi:Reverse transcriptase (RNA-dependent DNA polymerase)